MDYNSLPRKQLQVLCKKHDIPANLTNVQMADALTTLLNAEAKPNSDAKVGKKQSATSESGREESVLTETSNVPKVSTRSKKEAVKSAEEDGSEELATSAENVEGNGGANARKTRGKGLPKLAPKPKEQEDEIDEGAGKLCRGPRSERTCQSTKSNLSVVDAVSKKMDKKMKTSTTEDEIVDERPKESIEWHQGLEDGESLQAQKNDGRHLKHLRKKIMPEEQTKSKVVDLAKVEVTSPCKRTTRTRVGKVPLHPAVATESSVKASDEEERNEINTFEPSCENKDTNAQEKGKSPVIIYIVDSDDEEVVKDQEKEDESEHNTVVAPSDNAVTTKSRMGLNKRMPAQRTIRGRKTISSVEGIANPSESPKHVITRRGQKGVQIEKSVLNAGIEGEKNDAEASVNPSLSAKQVVTRKGCKGGHKEVVDAGALQAMVGAIGVCVEPTGTVHKEQVLIAGSEECKADMVDVSVEPTVNLSGCPKQVVTQRVKKGGEQDLLATDSVGVKNTVADISVGATVKASKLRKQVVTHRGHKGGHKVKEVVNASIEEEKADPVRVSVEPTVNPSESLKQVVTGRRQWGGRELLVTKSVQEAKKNSTDISVEDSGDASESIKQVVAHRRHMGGYKGEKVANASSQEDKVDVSDEHTVNPSEASEEIVITRGQRVGKKEELMVTSSVEEAKNIETVSPVEATVSASDSPRQVITRKGHNGRHKERVLKASSGENKVSAVCASVEPTVICSEYPKQVLARRGQKEGGQKEILVLSLEEDKNNATDISIEGNENASETSKRVVTCRRHKGAQKEELLHVSAEEDKVDISDEGTVRPSEAPEQIVTTRGRRGGQELVATSSVEEVKNIATDVPVASESPKQMVTRKGRKGERKEQVLKASGEEDKVDAICVSVEPIVNPSVYLKQVVTRSRRGQKGGQNEILVLGLQENKNNATDISTEDNVNASESPQVTHRRHKGEQEELLNASAEKGKVDPVGIPVTLTVNPPESPKQVATRRSRKDRQEKSLVTNIVEQAKNNAIHISVEANVNNEDDASLETSANPSSKQVITGKGRKGQCQEEPANASVEEDKSDAIDVSVECIEDQEKSCSEADESDGNENLVDRRNLKGKRYASKIKTRKSQQRQQLAKNLQQDKKFIMEEKTSDDMQKQSSSDTDGAITCRDFWRKTTCTIPDMGRHQEDLVQAKNHIDGTLHSSTLGKCCFLQENKVDAVEKDEAKAGDIVKEYVGRNRWSSSKTEVAEMKANLVSHRNLQRKTNTTRSQPRRSHTKEGPIENEFKKSSHQNSLPGNPREEIVGEHRQPSCVADITDVKKKLSSCRNSERRTISIKSETRQTCGKKGSTDVKCPPQEKQISESCQKIISSHGNYEKKDRKFVRFRIYDEDGVIESVNKRDTQEVPCSGKRDIETSIEKGTQLCGDAVERLSKSSNLIIELDNESEKDMLEASGCKDSSSRGKSVQKPSGESHNGKENEWLQTSKHGTEDFIVTVNSTNSHGGEVRATEIMVEAVEALGVVKQAEEHINEGSAKKPAIPMGEASKTEPEILTCEGHKERIKKETLNNVSRIVPTGDASFALPDKEQVASADCIASKVVQIAAGSNLGDTIHMDQGGYLQDSEEAHADRDDKFANAKESVIESEQEKIQDEQQHINKVVLVTSENTNESELGAPVYVDKCSGTEFRESTCMPMQVEDGVLEKHNSQFVIEMTSPIDQVEGGFHISSLIDQNLEVACVECSGNKINCFNGAEDESSDKVSLEGQVPELLENLHAISRLGSAEVDNLEALPADFPDIPDENMEGQDSEFMIYFECSPEKEKMVKHQVPVTKEVLHPKSGVGYVEVDNLEALLDNVTDILDENIEVQDSEFLVNVDIKEEEGSLADQGFNDLLANSKFICDIQEEGCLSLMNNVVCQLVKNESSEEMTEGGYFEMKSDKFNFSPHFTANAEGFSEKEENFSGETDFNGDILDESIEFEEEESKQPHGHSAGDQEDTEDLEKKSEDAYISSDLPAKDEFSEEQIVVGESMMIGSTVFMDNNLDKSLEYLEKELNPLHRVAIDQSRDFAGDQEDAEFQSFLNVADLKENKLDKAQVLKVGATEDKISVLVAFLHTSSELGNNRDGSVEERNLVSKLDVKIDNIPQLDKACEENCDSHICEEIDLQENIEVSSVGLQNDKFLPGEADKVKTCQFANSKEIDIEEEFPLSHAGRQNDYLNFKDKADEDESRVSEFSEEHVVQKNVFVSNRPLLTDSVVNDEAHEHELRGSSTSEEDNLNEGKEKELNKIQMLEISPQKASYGKAEALGDCRTREISVVNDGLQDHVSLVIDEAQKYQFNDSKRVEEFGDSIDGYGIDTEYTSNGELEACKDFVSQKNCSSKENNAIFLNVENHQLEHIPYNEVPIACETIPLSLAVLQYEAHGGVLCKSSGKQELNSFNSSNDVTPKKQEDQIPDVEILLTDQIKETLVEYGTSQVESNVQVWKDLFDNCNKFFDAIPLEEEAQSEQIPDSEVGHTENIFQNDLQVSNVSPIARNKIHAEEMGDIGSIDEQVALSDAITGKEDNQAERPLENEAEETKTYEENIQSTQMDSVYDAPNLLPSLQSRGESRREQFHCQFYHEDSFVEMDKETVHSSTNSSGVFSEECLVNDSAEKEISSGVNGMLLVHPLEFCGTSEQKFEQAGKMDSCKVEAYAADIVIISGLYDDSSESQGQKDSSLSGTPLKKLEITRSSNISLCSGMLDLTRSDDISPFLNNLFVEDCGTPLKKSGLRSSTNEMCRSGMNDSAMKESEETLLIDPCKKNLYELKTPLKLSELIKGHEELCTPSKKPELQSSTNVSPCSGMDNFTPQERQEVLRSESCKLEIPEFDNLLKMPELTMGPEKSLCLNSLAGEDNTSEKPDYISSTNVFPWSGVDDSAAEQIQGVLLIGHCKLGQPELDTQSKMSESRKRHEKSLCLYTFSGEDTPLKKIELTSIPNVIPHSGINDSSVEQSPELLTTEHCKLGLHELGTLSNMFEVMKGYDKSPCLDTLSGKNNPLVKIELISNNNITPCTGMDDSGAEQSQEVLMKEHCKLELPEVDSPSKMFELAKGHGKALHLNMLSGVNTPLKKTELTSTNTTAQSGTDDSSIEQSKEILPTEACKLGFSELDKIFECTKENDISPCMEALSVEDFGTKLKYNNDLSTWSGIDDSAVEQSGDALPAEAYKLEISENTSSKMAKLDRFLYLNTLFAEDITTSLKKPEFMRGTEMLACLNILVVDGTFTLLQNSKFTSSSGIDDCAVEQSGNALRTEACNLEISENTPSRMPELTNDQDITPCLNTLFVEDITTSLKKPEFMRGIDDSAVEQSGDALPTEACKLEISENTPSRMPELTNDQDISPCLNTLFVEDITTSLKKPEFMRGIDDSNVEQSGDALPTEACKLDISENTPSRMPELTNDQDITPCLNTLFVEDIANSLKTPKFMSGIDDSAVEQSGDALPTEACKLEISENTPSRMPELTNDHDITPCLNTLFVEDIATSLKKPEFMSGTDMHMPSCPNILFVDSTVPSLKNSELTSTTGMSPCSGIDESDVEQSGDVLPTDSCQLKLSKLNNPSAMPEFTKEDGRSPCLNALFVEDIATSLKKPELMRIIDMPLSSGMDDSAVEQGKHVLLTDACKPELSYLDTSSKMAEFTKEQDRSPCLGTLFLENLCTSFKKPEITSRTHVQCCSGMNEFDTSLKASKIPKGHSLSPSLNMLAGDLGTALEMPEPSSSTDISACSGVADSVLHKIQEIHWTEDFKHESSQTDTPLILPTLRNTSCSNSLIGQSFSTPSQRPKLADIDDLLQYAGMDDSAPEQSLEILPTEASKQQCYHSDTQLKMGEPMEGHNNPCSQSKLAVERDLNKLSLRQLQRMYKEKLTQQKESEKVAQKHPALQDLPSNVFGEEWSSFRKPEFTKNYKVSPFSRIGNSFQEQSQQACQTALCCNNKLFQVNTPLNEAEVTEGCDKLDRPEEHSTGCNDVLHQASVAGIRLPELTNNHKVTLYSVIDDPIPEQSQLARQTDLCCNNEPSQVYAPLKESEVIEGYCNLDRPEEHTGSKDVPYPVSVAVIRLHTPGLSCGVQQSQERHKPPKMHTPSNKPELAEGYDKPDKPEQDGTPLKKPELPEGYDKPDKPEQDGTPLKKPELAEGYDKPDKPEQDGTPLKKPELAEGYDKPDKPEQDGTPPLKKPECTAGYALCDSSVSEIKSPETSFLDEREVWVCAEEPLLLNNSVEPGLFVKGDTVCMKTPPASKGELRKTSLAIRLQNLKNRLETIQSNLPGQTPELSYATPLGKGMNYKSIGIGSGKKSRVPLSVSRPRLAELASTKENPTDQTQVSLKKDQRLHKEKQINSKDSEKVVGKRPALQNLSSNVKTLHIHEEDCS